MKNLLAVGLMLIAGGAVAQTTSQPRPAPTQTQTPTTTSQPRTPNITCPGDKVVWVNSNSKVYHYQGDQYFGNTKQGKFACEQAAIKEGDRASRR